jgi:hypothetical protein
MAERRSADVMSAPEATHYRTASLSRDWAALRPDPREQNRVEHDALSLFRQRFYQTVASYEDANDADRLRTIP